MKSFTKLEQGKTLLISGLEKTGKTTFATTLAQTSHPEKIIYFNESHMSSLKLSPTHFQKNEKTIIILDAGNVDYAIIEHYLYISRCYGISFIYITEYPYSNRSDFDFVALAQTPNMSILHNFHQKLIGKSLELREFIQFMRSIYKFEFLVIGSTGIPFWAESVPESIRVQRRCRCFRDELYFVAGMGHCNDPSLVPPGGNN